MKQIQGEDELQTGLTAVRNWQFEINTYKIEKNINKIINNFILFFAARVPMAHGLVSVRDPVVGELC